MAVNDLHTGRKLKNFTKMDPYDPKVSLRLQFVVDLRFEAPRARAQNLRVRAHGS